MENYQLNANCNSGLCKVLKSVVDEGTVVVEVNKGSGVIEIHENEA